VGGAFLDQLSLQVGDQILDLEKTTFCKPEPSLS
jgi:hypothetical protein